MSNSIPLNIGTLKDRKSRQEQADADLKLQILNSNRLARASRDYWINNEQPINSQPDYTTNEILNDRNKLLKILANDVKSMLDKEQFAIFMANNTWNNLNILRIAVQIFPRLKREMGKNLRLLTANYLVYLITNAVAETGYVEQARQQERQQNENEYNENGYNENGYNENGYNENGYHRADENPNNEDLYAGFDEPNSNKQNEMNARPRIPEGYYETANGEWERIPEGYYQNADGKIVRIPVVGDESTQDNNSSSASYRNPMIRQDSADSQISEISDPDFSTLVPSIGEQEAGRPKQIDLEKLKGRIDQLEELNEEQIIPIISKMINIRQNGAYNNSKGAKNKATREANKILEQEYRNEGVFDMDVEDRVRFKNSISRLLAGELITNVYQTTEYDFPEPTQTGPVFQKKGFGLQVKLKKGAKFGRGMAVQEMKGVSAPVKPDRSDLYYSFGVFAVHKKSLGDNILNLKYKSFSQVHKYPKRQISEDLKDILVDAIETKKINQKLFNALTDSDKSFLTELISEARLKETFPNIFKTKVGEGIAINENHFDRFEILKGELIAGNSSNEIKKELRLLVQKFMKDGLIEKKDGFGILELL
jgi:hypothetical protein